MAPGDDRASVCACRGGRERRGRHVTDCTSGCIYEDAAALYSGSFSRRCCVETLQKPGPWEDHVHSFWKTRCCPRVEALYSDSKCTQAACVCPCLRVADVSAQGTDTAPCMTP